MLKPGEVAKLFRVDPKTVSRWAANDRFVMVRTPNGHRRYTVDSVRAYLIEEGMTGDQADIAIDRVIRA